MNKFSIRLFKNLFKKRNKKYVSDIGNDEKDFFIEYDIVSINGLDGSLTDSNKIIYKFSNVIIKFSIQIKNKYIELYEGISSFLRLCKIHNVDYLYIPPTKDSETEYVYISSNLFNLSYLTSLENEMNNIKNKVCTALINRIDTIFKQELLLPTIFELEDEYIDPSLYCGYNYTGIKISIDSYIHKLSSIDSWKEDILLEIIGCDIYDDKILNKSCEKTEIINEYQCLNKIWIIVEDEYLDPLRLYASEIINLDKEIDGDRSIRPLNLVQISLFKLKLFFNNANYFETDECCIVRNTLYKIITKDYKYFDKLFDYIDIIKFVSETEDTDEDCYLDCDEVISEEDYNDEEDN